MIDNSPSMSPKQKRACTTTSRSSFSPIEPFGVNYHVGIITSDVGTTVSDGATWAAAPNQPAIRLAATMDGSRTSPATSATPYRPTLAGACATLCPDKPFPAHRRQQVHLEDRRQDQRAAVTFVLIR